MKPEYVKFIRGIKMRIPVATPVKISQSIVLLCRHLIRILVPFTKDWAVFKFLISSTLQFTFNANL